MSAAVNGCAVPSSCCYIDCVIFCSHPERSVEWEKDPMSTLTMEVMLCLSVSCAHMIKLNSYTVLDSSYNDMP